MLTNQYACTPTHSIFLLLTIPSPDAVHPVYEWLGLTGTFSPGTRSLRSCSSSSSPTLPPQFRLDYPRHLPPPPGHRQPLPRARRRHVCRYGDDKLAFCSSFPPSLPPSLPPTLLQGAFMIDHTKW